MAAAIGDHVIRQAAIRWRAELQDLASYSTIGRTARAIAAVVRWLFSFPGSKRIARRFTAIRLLPEGPLRTRLVRGARAEIDRSPGAIVTAHAASPARGRDGLTATRTTVLKAPGTGGERGVIYAAFEYNWIRILEAIGDVGSLLAEYDVIWATSWSPTDYFDLARVVASSGAGDTIYVQGSNFAETPTLAAFHPRIRVLPNLLCEYLDPATFEAVPADRRDIDLLVVSNWAPFKRHFELFRALRRMPRELRIVCVGQPERGYTLATIERLASAYGVRQAVDFRESLPLAEVRALQARSRAAAIFSRREGSCVAAVEALFAGASLGLMDRAHVGATAYLNPMTGVSLRSGHVAQDLMQLVSGAATRSPRQWAMTHVGADSATAKLNGWLRERSQERRLPWTTDIAHMAWSPYPYVDRPAERAALLPAVRELSRRFPGAFREGLLEESRY